MAEMKIEDLAETVGMLAKDLSGLSRMMDKNDEAIREKLAELSGILEALKTVIYGNEKYRLKGLLADHEESRNLVKEIVEARKSEKDQLRGLRMGLFLTGGTGITTLITVLLQIYT